MTEDLHRKTSFTILGRKSGWVRGPYKTLMEAEKAAHELSVQKDELVEIRRTIVTTINETIAEVSGQEA
jgi:hypothetical protein